MTIWVISENRNGPNSVRIKQLTSRKKQQTTTQTSQSKAEKWMRKKIGNNRKLTSGAENGENENAKATSSGRIS